MLGVAQQNPFLALFGTLVIIVVVGGVAHLLCEFCDNTKYQRFIDKGTKIGAIGTLISMGLMVMVNVFDALSKFIHLVFG